VVESFDHTFDELDDGEAVVVENGEDIDGRVEVFDPYVEYDSISEIVKDMNHYIQSQNLPLCEQLTLEKLLKFIDNLFE